jgi:phosphoglycolate phosphatase-like HAD superfamily hydrolase
MSTTVVCWDIDGTLLSTGRAGVLALEDAALEVFGTTVDLSEMQTAGLTDAEIASAIAQRCGGDREQCGQFLRAYERRLPERLHCRQGRVMPGVHELLGALDGRRDVLNLLLTGNTDAGAAAKLRHYGLSSYFEHGAFCGDEDARTAIAQRAKTIAAGHLSTAVAANDLVVVGDTPHDVACGKAIGARTLGVATGNYESDDLRACDPDWVLETLPDADEFCRLVGLSSS